MLKAHITLYLELWKIFPHQKLNKTRNNTRLNNFLDRRTSFCWSKLACKLKGKLNKINRTEAGAGLVIPIESNLRNCVVASNCILLSFDHTPATIDGRLSNCKATIAYHLKTISTNKWAQSIERPKTKSSHEFLIKIIFFNKWSRRLYFTPDKISSL